MDLYPIRKHPRLKNFDYGTAGAYFLTICTKNKARLLADISVGRGILDAPSPRLTEYGTRVEAALRFLHGHTFGVTIDLYVIMPNHIHLIAVLDAAAHGASGRPRPTNAVIPKLVSSLKRYTNRVCGRELWQDSFHDHIIRDKADYLRIWTYIDQNPAKWAEDRYFTLE